MPILRGEWPDLNGDNDSFWSHEWVHHGMCFENEFNTFEYYQTTLDLKNRIDLFIASLGRPNYAIAKNKVNAVLLNPNRTYR